MATHPELLGQMLQAINQVLEIQQQQVCWQQEWMQHNLSYFKMPKMTQDDATEAYIEAFERTAMQVRLNCTYWATQLGALLIGKAQAAYRALSKEDTQGYGKVKSAILYHLEITPEHYYH